MFGKRQRPKTYLSLISTLLFMLFLVSLINAKVDATEYVNIPFNQPVSVCPLADVPVSIQSLSLDKCMSTQLGYVDVQDKLQLIAFSVDIPGALVDSDTPQGLYFFGKNASQVYLNGILLGQNGQPASDTSEVPGKMDSVFYIPNQLLRVGKNELTIVVSAQHNYLHLGNPVHFMAIGPYQSPLGVIQTFGEVGLILIGAFTLGAVYFGAFWFYHRERRAFGLFTLMCVVAALQLGAEIYRGLVEYSYPVHDIRLILITTCSVIFGLSLLAYTSMMSQANYAKRWFAAGAILTILAVLFAPGFDFKTLLAFVLPLIGGLLLSVFQGIKQKRPDLLQWSIAQGLFLLTSWLATAMFHEFLYFLLVAGLLMFLLYQQAKDMALAEQQRAQDQSVIAKLEYQLAQQASQNAPTRLEITIGGKTEMVDSDSIAYCKAAGDYVELHLCDQTERLYSGSLKTLEGALPDTFLRVHRSYLVNLSHVVSLHGATPNNSARLELKNQAFVDVSRRLLPSVRATITAN